MVKIIGSSGTRLRSLDHQAFDWLRSLDHQAFAWLRSLDHQAFDFVTFNKVSIRDSITSVSSDLLLLKYQELRFQKQRTLKASGIKTSHL